MTEEALTRDARLAARLTALRQFFVRLDAGLETDALARLPGGETGAPGFGRGEGLRASGALLACTLLGREEERPLEAMEAAAAAETDRHLRRLCELSTEMLREDDGFSQAALYASMRTAAVFLPEGGDAEADLPGLIRKGAEPKAETEAGVNARWAWADGGVLFYLDLPPGVEEARVQGETFSAEALGAGVCLKGDADAVEVEWAGARSVIRRDDPFRDLELVPGFRVMGRFLCAQLVPRRLWPSLTPWIRARGKAGATLPAATLVTSRGQTKEPERTLTEAPAYLRCPPVDPGRDAWIELRFPRQKWFAALPEA